MYLSIPVNLRVEAKKFFVFPLDAHSPEGIVVGRQECDDFFPVGVHKVEEVMIRRAGSSLAAFWIVVSSALTRGIVLGQPSSVVEAWARYGTLGLHLGDSVYEKAEQLPLF